MPEPTPLVLQLQADAIDKDMSASNLLRKAKITATKLSLSDLLCWVNKELDGYVDTTWSDLPKYRHLVGQPKVFNPYHGWQPMFFRNSKQAKFYSRVPVVQSIGSLEETLRDN